MMFKSSFAYRDLQIPPTSDQHNWVTLSTETLEKWEVSFTKLFNVAKFYFYF